MFTGLVEKTAKVKEIRDAGEGKRITLENKDLLTENSVGASISVSGTCLTIEEFSNNGIIFFLAEETLEKTWFDNLQEGDVLNLENSLTPQDKMGGHYVQGHVDTTAEILNIEELEEGWNFTFSLPEEVSQYIVQKGFVTAEGISLTVADINEENFTVTVIPETWDATNLSEKDEGEKINIEADIMAKYAEKSC
jgi:riboflavin synthase